MQSKASKSSLAKDRSHDELLQLRNIGKSMRADFELLNIISIRHLAKQSADEMYARIQALSGTRRDPWVWDTYAAAIHQAKTGEALPWWDFTKVRKNQQEKGDFSIALPRHASNSKERASTSKLAS